jgi:membrane-bound lytic murein transglycosylase D
MKKILLMIVTICSLSFASLTHDYYTNDDVTVLKEFDIDETFLKDPVFHKMVGGIATYNKDRFIARLNNAYLFIPILKKMIQDAGIPPAFLYLAMAESNFSLRAYSRKKAVGLWQFMPYTGRKFGLRIDQYVDERRDLIKSTEAAIKYLKYLHKRFGKWYLAALAYNCGEGRLNKGIKRAKGDTLSKLLKYKRGYRRQNLPKETRNYIRKILSLALMANRADFLLLGDSSHLLSRGATSSVVKVSVRGGVHLRDISRELNMPYNELKSFNRHLKHDLTPAYLGSYDIYIPYSRLAFFKANAHKLKNVKSELLAYKVQRGDSLFSIGRKFGVPYRLIKSYNKLRSNVLSIKQTLIIPIKNNSMFDVKRKKNFVYRVKRGDSLGKISRRFSVSVQRLKQVNKLRSSLIKVGDKIVISN